MMHPSYRFRFLDSVPLADVEDILVVVYSAAQGIHGRAEVRLDARFSLDLGTRTCRMDASTEVGRTLARIFTEMLIQSFGEESFRVVRVEPPAAGQLPPTGLGARR